MKRAFVIGHPIDHSRSPLIHSHWLETYGIEGRYEAIDVESHDLERFLDRVRAGDFVGGNVTIPHKELVYSLCDELDPLAEEIGAVNTIVARGNMLTGSNTDYLGFLGHLDRVAPGWDEGLEQVVVLGAGGAARAILVALKSRSIPSIHLLNRTVEKAQEMCMELGGPMRAGRLSDFSAVAGRAGLVVNCSSVGLHGSRFETLDLGVLPKTAIVTDVVYVPLITPLLADARARGLRTVDGLGMLLHQAAPGFEAWFGVKPEVTPELRRLIEATL